MLQYLLLLSAASYALADGDDARDFGLCTISRHCYHEPEDIGCFNQGPLSPFCHQGLNVQSPQEVQPTFQLFASDGSSGQTIDYFHLTSTVNRVHFDASKAFYLLVHGFGGEPKPWMVPMKNALVAKGHNVVIAKWTHGSKFPDYFQAVANTRLMGAMVSVVLNRLRDNAHLDLGKTTIVGFSLGAHVAGMAGKRLSGLRRIIGLDPAGPLFMNGVLIHPSAETRLDAGDARFVQNIHTNGDDLFEGGAGTMQSMGHVDFFANGGKIQPGCHRGVHQVAQDIFHLDFTKIFGDAACSHIKAPKYFTALIKQDAANPCDPAPGPLLDLGTSTHGRFFFTTNAAGGCKSNV